jgi:hypothetical protein
MIDSKGGAFGFDCCLASPKFRVFQQPVRGIVSTYQTHDYADEVAIALQTWADHVERLVGGSRGVSPRGRR